MIDNLSITHYTLNLGGQLLSLATPRVMGILNVTPDSFYDGSRCPEKAEITERVHTIVREGADIIDIGGYSSRPHAADISPDEEMRRLSVGLEIIRKHYPDAFVSVDTFRAEVARRCVEEYGVQIINDISGGELDHKMFETAADLHVPYILMHMRGTPQTMQSLTDYEDVIAEVRDYLAARAGYMISQGMRRENIILDPGFGFAKTVEQNYRLLGITPEESLCGTQVLNWEALRQGASILRVHDVREAAQTLKMYETFKR